MKMKLVPVIEMGAGAVGQPVITAQPRGIQYHIYLTSAIEEPATMINVIELLSSGRPEDEFVLHINGPGGQIDTTVQLLTAMGKCQSNIVTMLEFMGASAHSLIFLSGDQFQVSEFATIMIHNASGGAWGKLQEATSSIKNIEVTCHKLMDKVYGGFLTPKEIREVKDGKDFYFEADQIVKRVAKMRKFRAK